MFWTVLSGHRIGCAPLNTPIVFLCKGITETKWHGTWPHLQNLKGVKKGRGQFFTCSPESLPEDITPKHMH